MTLGGATTCELLLTSMQASEESVAVPLCDMLIAAGAHDELSDPDVLTLPLRNAAPATAAALVRRGVVMDLRMRPGWGHRTACKPYSLRALTPSSARKRSSLPVYVGSKKALSSCSNMGHEEIADTSGWPTCSYRLA